MSRWKIQITIPDFRDSRRAEQLPRTVLQEITAQRQVRREIYHHLNRMHQGFFVSPEAADLVSGVATALLGMARVLENSGLAVPSEFTVKVSQRTRAGGTNPRVRPRSTAG